MTSQELFTTIVAYTYTTADFHRRIALLREYLEKKFYSGGNGLTLADFLRDRKENEGDIAFLETLGDLFFSSFTQENVYSILDEIEKELKTAPVVILYVSPHLPADQLSRIGNFLRTQVQDKLMIDLKFDPEAFGGSMFVWNGTLHDYSLKYLLHKHRPEISRIIGSYGLKGNPANPPADGQNTAEAG